MFAVFSIYACLTRCVLMECRPLTVQSTSGSGDPDPLQLTVTLSPSITKTLLWLTLISGKSENIHVYTLLHACRHRCLQTFTPNQLITFH